MNLFLILERQLMHDSCCHPRIMTYKGSSLSFNGLTSSHLKMQVQLWTSAYRGLNSGNGKLMCLEKCVFSLREE